MFTIEAERDGLQEQTLKKCVLQGKIRLTVNIFLKKLKKGRGGRRKEKETFLVKNKLYGKKKKTSIIRYVEKHIYLEFIYNRSVKYQYS